MSAVLSPADRSAAQLPARHAQVVPAFVAAHVSRPLKCRVGEVRPIDLLRWQRASDLTDSVRRDLRNSIIKRTRVKAERLWSDRVDVRLANDWRERLTSLASGAASNKVRAWLKQPAECSERFNATQPWT